MSGKAEKAKTMTKRERSGRPQGCENGAKHHLIFSTCLALFEAFWRDFLLRPWSEHQFTRLSMQYKCTGLHHNW